MKKKKEFKLCDEDYDYVNELLDDNVDETIAHRRHILHFIYMKYPKIFWEAYSTQL